MTTGHRAMLIFAIILIAGFALRFLFLDIRPLHHDEGVNYLFIQNLLEGRGFDYDPSNYHGPLTYMLSSMGVLLFGYTIFGLRFMSALFGFLGILLFYPLRKRIGERGFLVSAALFAISPTMVYHSRYLISFEIFIFFIMGFIVSVLKFRRTGNNLYVALASLSFTLGLATNEIAILFGLIFASFWALNHFHKRDILREIRRAADINGRPLCSVFIFILVFIISFSAVQSVFFQTPWNISGFFGSIDSNLEKSLSTGHNKHSWYYLELFYAVELTVFALSLLGLLYLRKSVFNRFFAFWFLLNLLIFSSISYKTPWVFALVIFPCFFLAGISAEDTLKRLKGMKRIIVSTILTLLVLSSLATTITLNFIAPADEDINRLAYVQSTDALNEMVKDIERYSDGKEVRILITTPQYWPLPFYLRGYEVNYFTEEDPSNEFEYEEYDIIISVSGQIKDASIQGYESREFQIQKGLKLLIFKMLATIE